MICKIKVAYIVQKSNFLGNYFVTKVMSLDLPTNAYFSISEVLQRLA